MQMVFFMTTARILINGLTGRHGSWILGGARRSAASNCTVLISDIAGLCLSIPSHNVEVGQHETLGISPVVFSFTER